MPDQTTPLHQQLPSARLQPQQSDSNPETLPGTYITHHFNGLFSGKPGLTDDPLISVFIGPYPEHPRRSDQNSSHLPWHNPTMFSSAVSSSALNLYRHTSFNPISIKQTETKQKSSDNKTGFWKSPVTSAAHHSIHKLSLHTHQSNQAELWKAELL